jgi:hypothetical protein
MTVDSSTFFIPCESCSEKLLRLARPLAAVQLVKRPDGGAKLGLVSQLSAGTEVKVCGDGFNERTIKVRAHGLCYFVFRADLLDEPANKN